MNRLGHRHVFGVLVPDFNSVVEPELSDLRVAGVTNQTARFALDAQVLENIASSAGRLKASGVESWVVGLATESIPGGMELLESGIGMLRERTELPVYSATHGLLRALEVMKVRRIGIVTPFDDAANENVRAFYHDRDFDVESIVGLNRPGFDEIASTTDEETLQACEIAGGKSIEALVQVGTGLPMLHLVEPLEARFGCPVLSSNAGAYWSALRGAGIEDTLPGRGRLFAEF